MHPEAQHLPGLVIYRFDAPLFFANAKTFRDEVRRLARTDPPPIWIVIAAEPVTDVDTTASDVLEELDSSLNARALAWITATGGPSGTTNGCWRSMRPTSAHRHDPPPRRGT